MTNWNDGKARVNLMISGKKSYDKKGDNYSRGCKVGWKLYEANSSHVIDSGTFTTSNVKAGESFSDCIEKVYDLPIGDYTLTLHDVG